MLGKIGELLKGVSEIVEKAGIDETESEKDAAEGGIADTGTESLNHNDAEAFEVDPNNITSEIEASNSIEKMTDALEQASTALNGQAETALNQIGANDATDGSSTGVTAEQGLVMHENAHVSQHSNTATDIAENVSVDEAISILEQARTTLNESGIDSDLRDVVNHPDALTMLENLQAAGVDELTVSGSDIEGLSAEEQITSVLQAAQEATYEQGLDMPEVEQEMTQEAMTTSFDYQQYDHGNDDYGIV